MPQLEPNIGNVAKLTDKGYNVGTDVNTANAFFKEMEVFAAKGCPFKDLEDGKKAKQAVAGLIARAKHIR